ncbi:hypothetical protein [Streptomyces sp. SID12488]|uniref:hypothetical protein n=1 Tax=Streptomyces sp. SID12488 TaxID=2706040 RepID=UPI0013DBEF9E|nr:hypothetical protein [Streptomyces sp. SID12488]NEA63380.1 hypothetical protein [Streptomyces sp. SID12488]
MVEPDEVQAAIPREIAEAVTYFISTQVRAWVGQRQAVRAASQRRTAPLHNNSPRWIRR